MRLWNRYLNMFISLSNVPYYFVQKVISHTIQRAVFETDSPPNARLNKKNCTSREWPQVETMRNKIDNRARHNNYISKNKFLFIWCTLSLQNTAQNKLLLGINHKTQNNQNIKRMLIVEVELLIQIVQS